MPGEAGEAGERGAGAAAWWGGRTAPSEDHGTDPTPKSLPRQQELGAGTLSTPWGLGGWGPPATVLAVAGFGGGGGVWQRAPPGFPWTPPPVSYAVWPHGADRASGGWMDGRTDGQGDGTPKYIATLEASGKGATGMAPTSAPRGGGCQPAPMPHRGGCHPVPMPKRGLSPCPHASWGAATIQEPLRTTGTRPSLSPGGHRSPRTGQQHPGDAGTQGRAGGGCHLPGRPPALPPAPLHLRSSTPPGNCFY